MEGEEGKAKGLTIAELRKLKSYEQLTDEQAQEVVMAVKALSGILCQYLSEKRKKQEELTNKTKQDEDS